LFHSVTPAFIGNSAGLEPAQQQAKLIESIYMTVRDPEAWKSLLQEMVAATTSRSARLLVMNAEATQVTSSIKINIDDHYHRQYTDYYVNKCPWRPELQRKAPGRLYSTYLHFCCRQPEYYHTEFFNDWARGQDIHHGLCGTIYRDSRQTVQLLIQRTRDQGHYTKADASFVNHLVPHMQHSFLIAGKIAHSRAQAEAIAIAAENEPLPFLLLDKNLKVIYTSPAASGIISGEPLLALKNDRLTVAEDFLDRRLNRLLRECLWAADTRRFQTGGGSLSLPRPIQKALKLLVKPVHPDIPLLVGQTGGFVAVYLHEPEAPIKIDPARLRGIYGLSEAEANVAVAMVTTPDSKEVAKRCAISPHTLRSHIKSIFNKTQTRNRAALMKLLLTGPARLP